MQYFTQLQFGDDIYKPDIIFLMILQNEEHIYH